MTSTPFLDALDQVVTGATGDDLAVVYKESVAWRWHRRLLADVAVFLRNTEVRHL